MTAKDKRFPLPLSSVVNQKSKAIEPGGRSTAMPQTAMRNAAHHLSGTLAARAAQKTDVKSPQGAGKTDVGLSPSLLSGPLVSEGIRKAMVMRVAQQGVKDATVLAALQAVPRHLFLESGMASQAYVDASLPIGHHQTISQPYIVARMIEVLRNGTNLGRVLEIGTGCGYQAAVLSVMTREVYSIERIKALHELAKSNLRPMRIANIRLLYGDGMLGLPQEAPFDGIILAAAGLEVPQSLLKQLRVGGRLVAPVGGRHQVLQLIERVSNYEWKSSVLEQCHFVPLHSGVI
ncbi:protein-L-isoaspartate(D-aspartate) O-methyltransferase [Undibacterium sp. TS12]|uniref:protein-L-isoaspartate(D-aspartate) O-methyltransferase n=1 Tax=Undibacterium sp. TS12 TaxID=2908202 RepID=UPI001F4CCC81|nr:protein-L-isoaspartate(D-aspartate) O-methyltransferase [Undibacterium sp. TS12]MCH8618840.1 protein-L-isoaspartate(D-aspartate) O-methyltransferase [Undibacterium sp. TS12]